MLIHEALIQSAGRVPGNVAIYFKDRKITYAVLFGDNRVEAAVVGRKEAAKGELPIAFITAKSLDPLDLKQIKEFCISRLARYKVPRQFIPLSEMPKTGSGKINKAELRKRAGTPAQEKESA